MSVSHPLFHLLSVSLVRIVLETLDKMAKIEDSDKI